jgi:hypothetical protein
LNPLEVSIVQNDFDRYFEPMGGVFVVQVQPVRLFVQIKNTSGSARNVRVEADKAYSIELTDDGGLTTVIKRKKSLTQESRGDITKSLAPGQVVTIPILLDRENWEGFPNVVAGKEQKFRMRAAYEDSSSKTVWSKSYTLVFRL